MKALVSICVLRLGARKKKARAQGPLQQALLGQPILSDISEHKKMRGSCEGVRSYIGKGNSAALLKHNIVSNKQVSRQCVQERSSKCGGNDPEKAPAETGGGKGSIVE